MNDLTPFDKDGHAIEIMSQERELTCGLQSINAPKAIITDSLA